MEACAQGLAEVSVVGDTALQGFIKVNEGGYDDRNSHSISLQGLDYKRQKEKMFSYNDLPIIPRLQIHFLYTHILLTGSRNRSALVPRLNGQLMN